MDDSQRFILAGLLSNFSAIPGQQNPMAGLGPSLLSMGMQMRPDALQEAKLKNDLLQSKMATEKLTQERERQAAQIQAEAAARQNAQFAAMQELGGLLGTSPDSGPIGGGQTPQERQATIAGLLARAGSPGEAMQFLAPPKPEKLDENVQGYLDALKAGVIPPTTSFESYVGMVKKPLIQQMNGSAPLSVSDVSKLQLPNGQPVPYGISQEEARKLGAVPVQELSPAGLKIQDEGVNAIGSLNSTNSTLKNYIDLIDNGKLDLGPVRNVYSSGKNLAGASDELSRNYGSFVSDIEGLRNNVLMLANGVQTEGDAKRAMNQLLANLNDKKFVRQRLDELVKINERSAKLQLDKINLARKNNKLPPMTMEEFGINISNISTGQGQAQPPAGFIVRPRSSGASGRY